MDYVPTKITLTRKCGFTEEAARQLGELSRYYGNDPRELAAWILVEAIDENARAMENQKREEEQEADDDQLCDAPLPTRQASR